MSWYDPTSWDFSTNADRENAGRQKSMTGAAGEAGGFAGQGQAGFTAGGQSLSGLGQTLQDRMNGKNLVSGELLRQGMQQGQAAQMSMAAGATPGNQAMAAQNAANNMNRLGYGLSGQQAVAGMQESDAARKAYMDMLLQQRQQDLQAALGSRQNQMQGLGTVMPQSSQTQMLMGGLGGLAGSGSQIAAAASDKRLKKDISNDDDGTASRKILSKIRPASFSYKDERFGSGKQYGIMAQDLEKSGLGHAVIDTPAGKMVHAGKAATSALGLAAALAKRVDSLERGGKR